jgi:branched-chain amino acid aminotransferase
MANLVYFNGLLRHEHEVNLSILDRSYLYGEGLFETMRATQGFIPFLQEHLSRLFKGLDLLQMHLDISGAKVEFALYQTLHHNRLKNAALRMTLSRENVDVGDWEPGENTNLIVVARPLPRIPPRLYAQGCSAHLVEDYRIAPDRLCQVKTTNYLRQLLAWRKAKEKGADEALLTNTSGRLVEGATTNLFLFDGEKYLTPSLEEGILPGVTRQILIDLMVKTRLPHEERGITLDDLFRAKEAFLTNSIKEIVPLTKVDNQIIGGGEVGPKTQHLMQLFKEDIQYRFERFESRRWGVENVV